jgi:hypothetical protein
LQEIFPVVTFNTRRNGGEMAEQPEGPITLEFIGRQLERILDEQAAMRGRLDVLTAALLRLDASVQGLFTEMHAIHVELAGFDRRLHKLEAKP